MNNQFIDFDINRETLVDKIVANLEKRILSGDILPKSKISEPQVAKEFNVSRIPAREALQRLEDMNFVKKVRVGREVVKFSIDEFQQLYEFRIAIEGYATMLGSIKAVDNDIEKIRSLILKMEQSVKDSEKLRIINSQFHDFLVGCSQNRKLIESYHLATKQLRWATPITLNLPDRQEQSIIEHKAIFDAFSAKKKKSARNLMEKHTNGSMKRILSRLVLKKSRP